MFRKLSTPTPPVEKPLPILTKTDMAINKDLEQLYKYNDSLNDKCLQFEVEHKKDLERKSTFLDPNHTTNYKDAMEKLQNFRNTAMLRWNAYIKLHTHFEKALVQVHLFEKYSMIKCEMAKKLKDRIKLHCDVRIQDFKRFDMEMNGLLRDIDTATDRILLNWNLEINGAAVKLKLEVEEEKPMSPVYRPAVIRSAIPVGGAVFPQNFAVCPSHPSRARRHTNPLPELRRPIIIQNALQDKEPKTILETLKDEKEKGKKTKSFYEFRERVKTKSFIFTKKGDSIEWQLNPEYEGADVFEMETRNDQNGNEEVEKTDEKVDVVN